MIYNAQYKCRLCGKIYDSCSVSNENIAIQNMLSITQNIRMKATVDEKSMHSCGNGNLGLSDFIGFVKEDSQLN